MKKIKLEIFKTANKRYEISVGFRDKLIFRTKKDAEKYVRRYKKIIEMSIRLCLSSNTELIGLYRLHYFQIPTIDVHLLDSQIVLFNDRLNYVFKQFSEGNSSMIFTNIEKLFEVNFDIINALKEYAFTHKEVSLKYQIMAIEKNINYVYNQYEQERVSIKNEARYLERPTISITKKLKKA